MVMDNSNQRLGPNALESRGEGEGVWRDESFLSSISGLSALTVALGFGFKVY